MGWQHCHDAWTCWLLGRDNMLHGNTRLVDSFMAISVRSSLQLLNSTRHFTKIRLLVTFDCHKLSAMRLLVIFLQETVSNEITYHFPASICLQWYYMSFSYRKLSLMRLHDIFLQETVGNEITYHFPVHRKLSEMRLTIIFPQENVCRLHMVFLLEVLCNKITWDIFLPQSMIMTENCWVILNLLLNHLIRSV